VRRAALVALLGLVEAGAGAAGEGDEAARYLGDARFRRAALEASLAHAPQTRYAARRLARYATGDADDWERRPEWNPTEIVISAGAARGDRAALRALGEAAFFRYPAQLAPWAAGRAVPATVRVRLGDGSEGVALTCATCHVRLAPDGTRLVGAGATVDLGRAMLDGDGSIPPARAAALAAWGPGRVDVTTDDDDDPVRIPDLRPVRWQTHLHHGGAVAQTGEAALAIRIETLIINAYGGALRPPRPIALGLALYLWSLADALPPPRAPRTADERRGQAIFVKRCARCHRGEGLAGPPVEVDRAGTDPRHAANPDRGTGAYRAP
jgi:mono/diheme cytochrome c family protein